MKKLAIISLSMIMTACASETYTTDVTSESYREDYTTTNVAQSMTVQEEASNGITESNVVATTDATAVQETGMQDTAKNEVQAESNQAVAQPNQTETVAIVPPAGQQATQVAAVETGYTIQVAAVSSQDKVRTLVGFLPNQEQPIWENRKEVNGTQWFAILFGHYATPEAAQAAMAQLPADFLKLKPFVKSIRTIKDSAFPQLNPIK